MPMMMHSDAIDNATHPLSAKTTSNKTAKKRMSLISICPNSTQHHQLNGRCRCCLYAIVTAFRKKRDTSLYIIFDGSGSTVFVLLCHSFLKNVLNPFCKHFDDLIFALKLIPWNNNVTKQREREKTKLDTQCVAEIKYIYASCAFIMWPMMLTCIKINQFEMEIQYLIIGTSS